MILGKPLLIRSGVGLIGIFLIYFLLRTEVTEKEEIPFEKSRQGSTEERSRILGKSLSERPSPTGNSLLGVPIPDEFVRGAFLEGIVDSETCSVKNSYFIFLNISAKERGAFEETVEAMIEKFSEVEVRRAEIITDDTGSYILLSPLAREWKKYREEYRRRLVECLGPERGEISFFHLERYLRDGGKQKVEIYFDRQPGFQNSFTITVKTLNGSLASTGSTKAEKVFVESWQALKRWEKLEDITLGN